MCTKQESGGVGGASAGGGGASAGGGGGWGSLTTGQYFQGAGLIMQGAGLGFGIGGAVGQAWAHNLSVRYNARQMEHNAEIARMQAGEAREAGYEQRAEWRRGVKALVGKQRAAAAGSGVLVGTGSPGAIEAQTKAAGKIGEERIRIGAEREAWYLQMMALQYSTQAKLLRKTKASPWLAGLGAAFGGSGQLLMSAGTFAQGLQSPAANTTAQGLQSPAAIPTKAWNAMEASHRHLRQYPAVNEGLA